MIFRKLIQKKKFLSISSIEIDLRKDKGRSKGQMSFGSQIN